MSANHWIISVSVLALSSLSGWEPAQAQQTTGVSGSPDAIMTI